MSNAGGNRISEKQVTFASPALQDWTWTSFEIEAPEPGPRFCIMAGIHVNEVSSIDAVFRLRDLFAAKLQRGRVSLMPVVNLPAVPSHAQFICPIDGKNINFCFPGNPQGSFSEILADAILNEWAADAECLVDLHGGDLCEKVARFTVAPLTGDAAFDERIVAMARAFAPEILVKLPPAQLDAPGRSVSGRARQRRYAAFAEAGGNGLIDEVSVAFHVDGVLRLAGLLGMLEDVPPMPGHAIMEADEYHWVGAEMDGWCRSFVTPGQAVTRGQLVAEICTPNGRVARKVLAPASGRVLWQCTHPFVAASTQLMGIGAASAARGTADAA
jgi:predicted deacylase